MFCSERCLNTLLDVKRSFAFIKTIIIINTEQENISGVKSLKYVFSIDSGDLDTAGFQPIERDSTDRTAFILYSSGTTGLPKGVMLTDRHIYYLLSWLE